VAGIKHALAMHHASHSRQQDYALRIASLCIMRWR
jgi:hypothetical protein